MIDIVFQLIAFFMLISNFEQTQADERIKLPRDELAKPPVAARPNELTLNIGFKRDETGNPTSGPIVFYLGEEIPISEMGPQLKTEAQLFKGRKTDVKDVTVVLRADGKIPTGLTQELIKLAQEAGFEQFTVKATKKEDY